LARRRYVRTEGRHVHYIRCGSGAPVVLVHPGIAHAGFLLPQMQQLAASHTCFAFDSAGFGCSDPAAADPASITDLAEVLAAAMQALQFPAVPVFGYHSGAVVALELAHRHPHLVSGLILDGLPLFTAEEVTALFSHDFAMPLTVDELGGHFAQTWTRFRDQTTFYPWYARTPEHMIPLEVAAPPEVVHTWMSYFFRSAKHYDGPFLGAHTYGAVAAQRLAALTMPAAFLMADNDLLARHAQRFPPLLPNQRMIRLEAAPAAKHLQLLSLVREFNAQAAAPADMAIAHASKPGGINRDYVDLSSGQMLVRHCGPAQAPALLLLHDAPGSALELEPVIAALGVAHRVLAFDLPGCGESEPLPDTARSINDYAKTIEKACRDFGIAQATVYGAGFGASLGIELARHAPQLVHQLLLHGVLLPTDDERIELRAHYAPVIAIDGTGAHWYRTWLMLRDSLLYWPWYRRTRASQRRVPADFGAQRLHDWTFEVMKQIHGYPHLIHAALEQHAERILPQLGTSVVHLQDPLHRCKVYDAALVALLPRARRLVVGTLKAAIAAALVQD
jgi:pimeloyl-ACP methyl ester carboxylesterase